MKRTKNNVRTLLYMLVAAIVGMLAYNNMDVAFSMRGPVATGIGALAFGVFQLGRLFPALPISGLQVHGIDVEIWVDRLVALTVPDNSIVNTVFRSDSEVLGGAVVHKPNAGANPAAQKNRTVFPGVAVRRTDTDLTYPLDVYTTDPTHIPNAEKMQINYNKVDSVLKAHADTLRTLITLDALYSFAGVGASQILRTTGSLVATNLSASATGTRRAITYADFVAAQVFLDNQDIPSEDRYALLDAGTYAELLKDTDVKNTQIQLLADAKKGVVGELMGFKIMKRSTNTVYDNTATPVKKAVGAAAAATDNKSSLFYHGPSLEWAMGDVRFYENLNDALYYGDVYSAEIKAGGRQGRGDGKGIVSIVQAAS